MYQWLKKNRLYLTEIIFICLTSAISFGEGITLLKPGGIYSVGSEVIEAPDFRFKDDKIQVFYPAEKHEDTYITREGETDILSYVKPNALHSEGHKFPLIIFIPDLGEKASDYTTICAEIASQGYIVSGLDLSRFKPVDLPDPDYYANAESKQQDEAMYNIEVADKYVKDLVMLLPVHPELSPYIHEKVTGFIGIKGGAAIAHIESAMLKVQLISILEPAGSVISHKEELENHILFFNDPDSINAAYYNNWIKIMNAQLWKKQRGEKPYYKKWAEQKHMRSPMPLKDSLYPATAQTIHDMQRLLKTINKWQNIYVYFTNDSDS